MIFVRLIEMSQPACNNVMLIGIVLLLASVILLGIDGESLLLVSNFQVVCQLRAWFLCLGFSLAFGAMFSKVWRVHRMSTKSKDGTAGSGSKSAKKKEAGKSGQAARRRTKVSFSVCLDSCLELMRTCRTQQQVDWVQVGLSLVDVLVLTIWAIVDPQKHKVESYPLENSPSSEEDIKIRPNMEFCESTHQNIWLGVFPISFSFSFLNFTFFNVSPRRRLRLQGPPSHLWIVLGLRNEEHESTWH